MSTRESTATMQLPAWIVGRVLKIALGRTADDAWDERDAEAVRAAKDEFFQVTGQRI